jgi:RimJ/RimL family protein N-acetyltransferase
MRDVIAIETERLKLRQLRMSDAARIARFCGDPGVGRMLAMTPLPYLDVAAEGWIMTLAARRPLARDFVFAVDLPGEGLIGAIGAHARGEDGFEVGYWFGRPYWGQGLATEALQGFLTQARRLGDLRAGHFVDNPASGRVLEKGGFAYTGETTPLFSLARGESVPCRRMVYAPGLAAFAAEREAATVH